MWHRAGWFQQHVLSCGQQINSLSPHSLPTGSCKRNRKRLPRPPQHILHATLRGGVQWMKLRFFRSRLTTKYYQTVSGVQSIVSSTFCNTSDSSSQPIHNRMRCLRQPDHAVVSCNDYFIATCSIVFEEASTSTSFCQPI